MSIEIEAPTTIQTRTIVTVGPVQAVIAFGRGDVGVGSAVEDGVGYLSFGACEPRPRGLIPEADRRPLDAPPSVVMTFPDLRAIDLMAAMLNVLRAEFVAAQLSERPEEVSLAKAV